MPTYFRSDQARIQVNIPGINLPSDSWSKMEGGDNVAETSQLLPGGMAPAIAQGGLSKRSDVVVHRPWSDTMVALFKQLDQSTGSARGTQTYTVLDANKNPVPGSSVTYSGVLKSVTRPNYDSSSSGEALLQLAFECDEPIA